jgi:hypothetical protein
LSKSFYDNLSHTRWGLDPIVHTLAFVRGRSAFLFTSLLAAAALFLPSGSALARRLQSHRNFLARLVMAKRLRSVELVLGFLINIPWMPPGVHAADDDTGLYISTALSIAFDLSMNKIITPPSAFDQDVLRRIGGSDCLEARRALDMDGFEDVSSDSEWGKRLLRRRERAWIALFVLERGICLARGRPYSVPITPLVQHCDSWHSISIADFRDGAMLSMAVLRRDLDGLFDAIRSRCDSYRVIDVGSKVAQEIETTINTFFDHWYATWASVIAEDQHQSLPPYVEILVIHTRLSTYCGVLNHPTAPLEVKRLFRASALSSALNVMRTAIQGETRLRSMPNNTVIMITFAACVALKLSTPSPGNPNLASSVKKLVNETAAVLERIGNITPHRNGASILYGRFLLEIVKKTPAPSRASIPHLPASTTLTPYSNEHSLLNSVQSMTHTPYTLPAAWMEPLQFSVMSNQEIMDTVLSSGLELSTTLPEVNHEMSNFMWMDWTAPPEFGV